MLSWTRRLHLRRHALPIGLFLAGSCLAVLAGLRQQAQIDSDARRELAHRAERIAEEVARRYTLSYYGLNGAKGMYATRLEVRRADFGAYVASRNLPRDFPGVRGFGFIQRVMRKDLPDFIAGARADGAPGFAVRSLGDNRHEDLLIIRYIEPASENRGVAGLDIGSEPRRRAAAQQAIDTGEPTITAPVVLVQDRQKHPGALLFVPMYRKGSHPVTVAERRAALAGLFYAPIVSEELLSGVSDVRTGEADFELYDMSRDLPHPELVYDSDHHLSTLPPGMVFDDGRGFVSTRNVSLPGRQLKLRTSLSPMAEAQLDRTSAWMVSGSVFALATLLSLLLLQQSGGRLRAEALARRMTERLRRDEERARDFSLSASDWFWETDAAHHFSYFSANFESVYGMAPEQLLGKSRQGLLEEGVLVAYRDAVALHLQQLDTHEPFKNFEYSVTTPAGDVRWISVSGIPHFDAEGHFAGYRGTGTLVTERKALEASLKASEGRYRALFERSRIPMMLLDPADGAIVDVNQAAEQFYGYPRDVFLTLSITRINCLAPETVQAEMRLAESQQRDHFLFEHRLASGEVRQVEVRSGPLDIDGRHLLYSAVNDITARRQAEDALTAERSRLFALLETASDGIHILNEDGVLVQSSRSFPDMLGYGEHEMIGMHVSAWDARIAPADIMPTLRQLLQEPATFETLHRCKDGRLIEVEIHAKGIDIDGESFLYAASRDISARKAAERELEEQRHRLNAIIEGTHAGTWEWNVQTGETVFNARWAEMLGYTLEELAPVSIGTWLRLAHPEDLARSEGLLMRHFSGETPYYECESRMRHKAGHWVWVMDRGKVASFTPEGQPLMMFGTHQDISVRKENEAKLEEARAQAEAASLAKSRFLATMSHEIRTPMNGILGMAQMLQMPDIGEAERQDYARIILTAGQSLLALLNDILDLSKVEAGRIELETQTFLPDHVLHEVRGLFADTARQKSLVLEARWLGAADAAYSGDPHRIRQMLGNLVGNAIKFTPAGRIDIVVSELSRDASGAELVFSVQDSGIGIPVDKQSLLFQPFSQMDSSTTRQFGGTGLGLSIVRSLAILMGGEAGVESREGEGARFWFRIRVGIGQVASGPERHDMAAPVKAEALAGHVLVVDDNLANQTVNRAFLAKLGVEATLADDGLQAVEAICAGGTFDLVLMDVQMPVMDGYTATGRIRAWEREQGRPPVPIIALTADAFADDRARCLACGMNDFLAKPLALSALKAMLARWLGQSAG